MHVTPQVNQSLCQMQEINRNTLSRSHIKQSVMVHSVKSFGHIF